MPPSRRLWLGVCVLGPLEPGRSRLGRGRAARPPPLLVSLAGLAAGRPEQGVQGTRGRAPQPEPQHPRLPLEVLCGHPVTRHPLSLKREGASTDGGRASRTAPQGVTPGWRPLADGQPCPRLPRSPTSGLGAAQGPAALPPTLTALAGLPRPLHTG